MEGFIYKNELYFPGTKVSIKTRGRTCIASYSHKYLNSDKITVHDFISGHWHIMVKDYELDDYIVEIIEPIRWEDVKGEYHTGLKGGTAPPDESVFVGWIWYILIMVVGAIFKERLLIWVFATAVFFLWKNGFFSKK